MTDDVRGWWRLPVLGGVLLGLGYVLPVVVFNLVALVPLLAALDRRSRTTAYERFKIGFVFGLPAFGIGVHFMYSMLAFSWLASLLYVGTVLGLTIRTALGVVLLGWLRQRTRLPWAFLLPVVWIPMEWAQTWGDLRLTVDHLSHAVARYPFLVQFADLLGGYGVDLVLLVTYALVYEGFRAPREPAGRRAWIGLILLWASVLAYDAWAWNREPVAGQTLRVGLVQPNVPLEVKRSREGVRTQWETLRDLSEQAAAEGAELIIWPESARPRQLHHWLDRPHTFAMNEVQQLARKLGVPFLVGVEYARIRTEDDYDLFNAAVAVDADGSMLDSWGAKVYLVPFTEAVPFKSVLGPLVEGRGGEWRWLAGGFDPGPELAVIEVAGARVGLLVCYEQVFPELSRRLRNKGANLQVVITNDAWWARSFFQQYQANALRLRAIENRTAFVRVANTGISGFVDPRGRYRNWTPLFEEAAEVADVELTDTRTVYDRVGDVVAWIAIGALLATLTVAIRQET